MSRQSETLLDLSLSRGTLDRTAHGRKDPKLMRRLMGDPGTKVIELRDQRARTMVLDGQLRLVLRAPGYEDTDRLAMFLGRDGDGTAYIAVVLEPLPEGTEPPARGWSTLREAGVWLDDQESGIFTAALALANWHATHPRCSRCGNPTEPAHAGWLRRCGVDGSEHYPRTDVAVIMAVVDREDRLLLARGPHWPPGRMSVLAGFVEPGESLEAAVAREVREEVGLTVRDIDYRGNQPWPFPAQMMVGFRAVADDTELDVDPEEIVEAAWFTRAELSRAVAGGTVGIPSRVSIARRLVEDWFGRELTEAVETTDPFRGTGPR